MRRVAAKLGVLQMDAVNVLVRAHYLPLFARLGPYDPGALDAFTYRDKALFEYPGHALSLLTIDHHPLMRWRMEQHRSHWDVVRKAIEARRPGYVDLILGEIQESGPLSWTDLSDPGRIERRESKYAESSLAWWRWSMAKDVLTHLSRVGQLAVAGRRNFEALYDLPDRVIPADVLAMPVPEEADAHRELVRRALLALGVGTAKDIADYYRLSMKVTRARLKDLVDGGAAEVVEVEGWTEPAWMVAGAKPPKSMEAHALVSPFDSLIWERKRSERVFDYKVSFEIYVPPAKRVYGYYVLAFLMGDRFAARVDLKADRARRVLMVPGAFLEPGCGEAETAAALAVQLEDMARWLSLDSIEVGRKGDLAVALWKAVRGKKRK